MSDLSDTSLIQGMHKLLSAYVSQNYSMYQLRQFMLDELIRLTGAKYAYMSRTEFNHNKPVCQTMVSMSSGVLNDCPTELLEKFPLDEKTISSGVYKFPNMNPNFPCAVPFITKKPAIFNDVVERKAGGAHCPFYPKGQEMKNFLSYPLMFGNKVIGTVGLACTTNGFTTEMTNRIKPLIDTMTNIEAAHDKQEQLVEQEREKQRVKNRFLGNMSHELRTPITAIIGSLTLLKTFEGNDQFQKYINIGLDAADMMSRLISDILDTASIESGKLRLVPEVCDLQEKIHKIVEIIRAASKKKDRIKFICHYPLDIPTKVYADKVRTKQIFYNLLNNAEKFTLQGFIICEVNYKKPNFIIQISDTGRGIDLSKFPDKDIFQRFSREDESTRTVTEGTGLGLSIVKNIVTLMGGKITYATEINKGTSFRLSIPFPLAENINEPEDDQVVEHKSNKSILLIEDNPNNQKIIKAILESFGCRVVVCSNGLEGFNYYKSSKDTFSVILMDCHMPVMDGYQATKEIRAFEKEHNLSQKPIIGLTASVIHGEEKCFDVGMTEFMEKPIDYPKLKSLLNSY